MAYQVEPRNAGSGMGKISAEADLVEILQWRAVHQPQRVAYRFLPDEEVIAPEAGVSWNYGELQRQVGAIGNSTGGIYPSNRHA